MLYEVITPFAQNVTLIIDAGILALQRGNVFRRQGWVIGQLEMVILDEALVYVFFFKPVLSAFRVT